MRTWTTFNSDYIAYTQNSQSDNAAMGERFINDSIRAVSAIRSGNWKWLETVITVRMVGNQQAYQIPNLLRIVSDLYVVAGDDPLTDVIYMPIAVFDPKQWKIVIASRLGNSDYPRLYYIENEKALFFPIPASSNNIINFRGRLAVYDLSLDDYDTGFIAITPYTQTLATPPAQGDTTATLSALWALTTGPYQIVFSSGDIRNVNLTTGSNAVTWTTPLPAAETNAVTINSGTGGSIVIGTGTTWQTSMANFSLVINKTYAANAGDGYWYRIDQVQSNTQLTLQKQYSGTPIVSGSAQYVIGQTCYIPGTYDISVIYRSVALYWEWQRNQAQAAIYWRMYDGGVEAGLSNTIGGIIGQMCDEAGATVEGPYISPNINIWWNPNYPQPDSPPSDFSPS